MGILESDAMAQLDVGETRAGLVDVDACATLVDLDTGGGVGTEGQHPGGEGSLVEAGIANEIVIAIDLRLAHRGDRSDHLHGLPAAAEKHDVVDPDVELGPRVGCLELDAEERARVDAGRAGCPPARQLLELLEAIHIMLPRLGELDIGAEVVVALAAFATVGRGGAIGHLEPHVRGRVGATAGVEGDAFVLRGIEAGLRLGEVEAQAGERTLAAADTPVHACGMLRAIGATQAHGEHTTVGARGRLDVGVAAAKGVDVPVARGVDHHLVVVVFTVFDHRIARARDRATCTRGRLRCVRSDERTRRAEHGQREGPLAAR